MDVPALVKDGDQVMVLVGCCCELDGQYTFLRFRCVWSYMYVLCKVRYEVWVLSK